MDVVFRDLGSASENINAEVKTRPHSSKLAHQILLSSLRYDILFVFAENIIQKCVFTQDKP